MSGMALELVPSYQISVEATPTIPLVSNFSESRPVPMSKLTYNILKKNPSLRIPVLSVYE